MARALARGWGQPVLCFDPVAERARPRWRRRPGGRRSRATPRSPPAPSLWCSATSPPSSTASPRRSLPHARAVASILAATSLDAVKEAYPERPVYRFMPSLPVEVRQGAVVQAADPEREKEALSGDHALDAQVRELFAELGSLVVLDDSLVDVAMGLMSCAPAYVALVAEAQIDAGVRCGIPAAEGARLVVQTLAGTAELLRRRDYDTLALRREVSSPGGLTARGVDALERRGVRAAFSDALDAVLRRRGAGGRRGGPPRRGSGR